MNGIGDLLYRSHDLGVDGRKTLFMAIRHLQRYHKFIIRKGLNHEPSLRVYAGIAADELSFRFGTRPSSAFGEENARMASLAWELASMHEKNIISKATLLGKAGDMISPFDTNDAIRIFSYSVGVASHPVFSLAPDPEGKELRRTYGLLLQRLLEEMKKSEKQKNSKISKP